MFYNLEEIKAVKCEEAARAFGLNVTQKGNSFVFKLRDEKTPSSHIYTNTNSWYDFGSNKGGSVIDLVKEAANTDFKTAVNMIADRFGIEPVKPVKNTLFNRNQNSIPYLTNEEYTMIGMDAELTMNGLFTRYNSLKNSQGEMDYYSEKYNLGLRQFAKENPEEYTRYLKLSGMNCLRNEVNFYINYCIEYQQRKDHPERYPPRDPNMPDFYEDAIDLSIQKMKVIQRLMNKALPRGEPKVDFSNKMGFLKLNAEEDVAAVNKIVQQKMDKFIEKYRREIPYVKELDYDQMKTMQTLITKNNGRAIPIDELFREAESLQIKSDAWMQLYKTYKNNFRHEANPAEEMAMNLLQKLPLYENITKSLTPYYEQLKVDREAALETLINYGSVPMYVDIMYEDMKTDILDLVVDINKTENKQHEKQDIFDKYKKLGKEIEASGGIDNDSALYKDFQMYSKIMNELNRAFLLDINTVAYLQREEAKEIEQGFNQQPSRSFEEMEM